MTKDKRRIQSCIDHINTAVDVDPWAKELVAEMGKEILEQLKNSNDCISRQTVIDALGDEPEVWSGDDEYAQGLNNQWHYDVNSLKAVPSVQPDIIACGDCKHYIPHDKRCGYWNHGVQPLMWCSQAERRTDVKADKGASC